MQSSQSFKDKESKEIKYLNPTFAPTNNIKPSNSLLNRLLTFGSDLKVLGII